MLKKERWIVYPLLMLSLFSSLVGVQVIKAQQEVLDRVASRELVVVNEEGDEVFSVVPNKNGGVRLFAGNKDSDEFFVVEILQDVLDAGILNSNLVLRNNHNSFSVSVGSENWDVGTTLSVSRLLWEEDYTMEHTNVTIGTNQNEGAIRLRRNDQSADLYLGEGGAVLALADPDNRSVATMNTSNEGAMLFLAQVEPMVVLMANKEEAGLNVASFESGLTHIDLSSSLSTGGHLRLYNERGDARSIISSTDKTGHGGIWLYDRYGDKSRSYTFY